VAGQYLKAEHFIKQDPLLQRMSEHVDPSTRAYLLVLQSWRQDFLEPQRENGSILNASLRRTATANPQSASRVDECLRQLRDSALLPRAEKPKTEALLRKCREVLELFMPLDAGHRGHEETGVTSYDVAFAIEEDERAAKALVKKLCDSKRMEAEPIGKCPSDGRRQLYRLPEVLEDFARFLTLTADEKSKCTKVLRSKCRLPTRK
jgi:hypothetical protein